MLTISCRIIVPVGSRAGRAATGGSAHYCLGMVVVAGGQMLSAVVPRHQPGTSPAGADFAPEAVTDVSGARARTAISLLLWLAVAAVAHLLAACWW